MSTLLFSIPGCDEISSFNSILNSTGKYWIVVQRPSSSKFYIIQKGEILLCTYKPSLISKLLFLNQPSTIYFIHYGTWVWRVRENLRFSKQENKKVKWKPFVVIPDMSISMVCKFHGIYGYLSICKNRFTNLLT